MKHSMKINRALQKSIQSLVEVAHSVHEHGWAEGDAGNISIDVTACMRKPLKRLKRYPILNDNIIVSDGDEYVLLATCAGSRLKNVRNDPAKNLLLIYVRPGLKGYHVLWGGEGVARATTELTAHIALYSIFGKHEDSLPSIIHVHPLHCIALSHKKEYKTGDTVSTLLWSLHPEMKMKVPEGIGFVPYHRPGSKKLAKATVHVLRQKRIAIWEKHGCIAIGRDIREALELIDVTEKAASIYFLCKSAGYEIHGLREQDLREIVKNLSRKK